MSKLHIAFLWHQHQPMYKNPQTGVYDMPWVRLHATKDYYDLAAILDKFPKIKFNINLVPSLLLQLEEYASGAAQDKFTQITLVPADLLSDDELLFLLHNFFMADWQNMIQPYRRYDELLTKRGKTTSHDELKRIKSYFKKQDILDLQVWFNLTWVDPYWRKKDPFISYLFEKEKNYSEEDKKLLIEKHHQICASVIPKHRELKDRGQVELSTTPFYHPILPLLCDTNSARIATPGIELPLNRFNRPEDASQQIKKAIDYYSERFGGKPNGFWPSEGSVSEEVASIFIKYGIKWLATDEDVLFRTNPALNHVSKNNLYEPYKLELPNGSINMVFRDHALSDAIGFVYSRWDARKAADDFMKKLHAIKSALPSGEPHLVSVILDGENCWEYYKNDGNDFLEQLLEGISNDNEIISTTISEYVESHSPKKKLHKLHAGSWIGGNFGVWIGHSEDNLSWDYLFEARNFILEYIKKNPEKKDSPDVTKAWEYLFIAEGSDWNWWYGDDHTSSMDMLFDDLYRANLRKIYEVLDAKVPDKLYIAIKGQFRRPPIFEPVDFLNVKLDGIVTSYFEWRDAGYYHTIQSGGSMHQVESVIRTIYYGFDMDNIYLRVDSQLIEQTEKLAELTFIVRFLNPTGPELRFSFDASLKTKESLFTTKDPKKLSSKNISAAKIIELAIPFETICSHPGDQIEFIVLVNRSEYEIERWPHLSSIVIKHPTPEQFSKFWSV